MKLRLIPASLACATLASGLVTFSAQASTAGTHHPTAARPSPATLRLAARTASAASGVPGRAGAIAGVIAGTGHKPLAGACVFATGPAGSGMAMTGGDGRYSINPLRPGKYTLHFSDCSAPGSYLDQWSGGGLVPTGASSVLVTAGQVKSAGRATLRATAPFLARAGTQATAIPGVRAAQGAAPPSRPASAGTPALAPGKGAIAGRVTGKGKPLKGICVIAYPRGRGRGARVRTTKSGSYRVGSLKPGRYYVAFYDCTRKTNWLGQYYKAATFYTGRRPKTVPVVAGKTTRGIDAALRLGGEIGGTVRNQHGDPLAKICAEAIGRSGRRFVFGGFARTAADGTYVMHAIIPATYKIQFSRCGNAGNYAPVWWRHSQSQAHATKIVIKSGTVAAHIDQVMPTGGAITGTVRAAGPHGPRLRRICVFAEGTTRNSGFAYTVTSRTGTYKLIGLRTGQYRLFYFRCGNRGNYLSLRRKVRVRIGHTISGFDAFLPLGGIARGVVTDSHGNPVAGICVQFQGRHGFGGTRTKSDGSYSVNAMRSGSYTVSFSGGCGNTGSYAPQFYNGQTNRANASHVELTAGQTVSGLNAAMQPGATIRGDLTDAGGNPVRDVCIILVPVSRLEVGFPFGTLTFARDGAYAAANLTPGLYAVSFGCFFGTGTLARQWFMAKPDSGTANLVSAPAGVVTSGVSAVLQASGTITGTVTNRDGKPLPRICVRATVSGSTASGSFFGPGETVTRKDGTYALTGLPPATYVIQYQDCGRGGYGSRWYQQKPSPQSATPVTVTPGSTTTGVDEKLAPGGSISGVVTTSAGTALPGACVQAFDAATQSDGFTRADRTGHYAVPGLATGSYQVTFYPCRGGAQLAAAVYPSPVAVTAPAAVAGVNGKLGVAGSIGGTVRDGAGKRQAGVCVVAVPADPGNTIGAGTTGQHGMYQIRGLGAGTYHVYAGDVFCGGGAGGPALAPQWYKGQQSEATATDVTVTAGASTAGIDAKLAASGAISGTVSHQGQPVAGECVTAFPVGATPEPLVGATLNPVIAVTASDGSYSLADLLPGQYHVEFTVGCGASGFAAQWWQQATSEQTASIVNVAASGTVTGIDASLP